MWGILGIERKDKKCRIPTVEGNDEHHPSWMEIQPHFWRKGAGSGLVSNYLHFLPLLLSACGACSCKHIAHASSPATFFGKIGIEAPELHTLLAANVFW